MNEILEKVKRLVAAGELMRALEMLGTVAPGIPGMEEQVIQLESRNSAYEKALRAGLVEPLGAEYNGIAKGVLDLVKEAEREENRSEDDLRNPSDDALELTPVPGEKIVLYYKSFRTGQIMEMKASPDMNTQELKKNLIRKAVPKYYRSTDLQEVFGFDLMVLRTGMALDDTRSLRENGLQPEDTVYLQKYFFNIQAEEEAVEEEG